MPLQSIRYAQRQRPSAKATGVMTLLAIASTLPAQMLPAGLAQPAATPTKPQLAPLTSETKAVISKAIGLAKMMDLIGVPIQLKVTDVDLEGLAAQINAVLVEKVAIEVRRGSPARFTLDIKEMSAAQILNAAATLSASKVYVFSDRLLIAGEKQLTDAERTEAKDWNESVDGAGTGWDAREDGKLALLKGLSSAFQARVNPGNTLLADPTAPLTVSLGALSPELQQMVQYVAVWSRGRLRASPPLSPDTVITFNAAKPDWHYLKIRSLSQGRSISAGFSPN